MKTPTSTMLIGCLAVLLAAGTWTALPQERGDRRGPPGRGGEDFRARFMDRMMDRFQEVLGASDQEWTVLEPLVQDVMEKQREARTRGGIGFLMRRGDDGDRGRGPGGRGPGRGGRGPFGGGDDFPEQAALAKAIGDDASSDEIQNALKSYREAVKEREAALNKAQQKLRQVVTVKQEATLVMAGLLE